MDLRLGRRAVVFTVVSIILVGLLILTVSVYMTQERKEEAMLTRTRVLTMNHFIRDVERDLNRGLQITGFRSLLAMQEYVHTNGSYIDDVSVRFREGVVNGTMYGSVSHFLVNSTLPWWLYKIQLQGQLIGIDVNISFDNLVLYHAEPWYVSARMNVTMNLSDMKGTADWRQQIPITVKIPIVDMEDPVYLMESNGTIANQIRITNFTTFNVSVLKQHISARMYRADSRAPDYLMRLEGNLSNSTYGIESIVDLGTMVFPMTSRSSVDYLFFGNMSGGGCLVNETLSDPDFSWLRMDSGHLIAYNVSCS